MSENFDYTVFIHPFSCVIGGTSKSGKTFLLLDIIKRNKLFIRPEIEEIIYCYSIWQPEFDDLKNIGVKFVEGILNDDNLNSNLRRLIIFDDLMDECGNNKTIVDLFTKGSHHRNISVILLTQNIFNKGKYSRTISLNSQYLIIFNNPRDMSQISYLSRQMFPDKPSFLSDVFRDVSRVPHGYLFIDNNQETPQDLRVQSSINEHVKIVYIRKK
jgi:hypothetical protein